MATVADPIFGLDAEAAGVGFAREVLRAEAEALRLVRGRLDGSIARAAGLILGCRGALIVTGMGKAGLVGQKVAATFASTGTPAFPLHPGEAVHGDLGRVREGDVVLALSRSGETEEVIRLVPSLRRLGATLIALTERAGSTLGLASAICLAIGPVEEACPLGLAPSASTTAMMAVGDALALLVSRLRGFRPEDFATYHPGGRLGRRLGLVDDLMRTGRRIRRARSDQSVREVFVTFADPRRRSGAVLLVGADERLVGIFTDSDLARLLEGRRDAAFDRPIAEVMTADPIRIAAGSTVVEAVALMRDRKISELPVVDGLGRPVGLIDLTDLIDLVPAEPEE